MNLMTMILFFSTGLGGYLYQEFHSAANPPQKTSFTWKESEEDKAREHRIQALKDRIALLYIQYEHNLDNES